VQGTVASGKDQELVQEKSPKPSRRLGRINSRIHFLITEVLRREINDPRIGFITVLGVEASEDVKEARVYLSVLGTKADRSKAEHALEDARGFLQREVGRNLKTRNTPTLRFIFDETQDKAARIEALIRKASQEDRTSNGQETFQKT
jgi:ribosome-binding factor A